MQEKKYLNKMKNLDYKIKLIKERLEEYKAKAENCSINMSDKVQSSSCNDISNIVVQIQLLEDTLKSLVSKQLSMQTEVIEIISQMENPTYAEIINRKYLRGENLVSIAYHMNYSYSYIKSIHGKALLEFRKIFQKKSKKQNTK